MVSFYSLDTFDSGKMIVRDRLLEDDTKIQSLIVEVLSNALGTFSNPFAEKY